MEFAAAGFWLFLGIVVAVLVWRTTTIKRERIATIRAAIEKGQPIDDELMSVLFRAGSDRAPRLKARPGDFFLVSGVLIATLGLCLLILGLFAWNPEPLMFALLLEVIAGALLLLWRLFSRRAGENG